MIFNETEVPTRIQQALMGVDGVEKEMIARVGITLVDKLLRKNSDYGSSVFTSPELAPGIPAEVALRVRLSDKIKRIKKLLSNPDQIEVPEETLLDTWDDFCGYSILLLALHEIQKTRQRPPRPVTSVREESQCQPPQEE